MRSKRFELKGCLWILDSCDRSLRFHTPFYVGSDGTQTVLIQIEISQRCLACLRTLLTSINLFDRSSFLWLKLMLTRRGRAMAVIWFGGNWGICSQSWSLHSCGMNDGSLSTERVIDGMVHGRFFKPDFGFNPYLLQS